ncbi:hypothetical protein LWI28_020758 [Acer negundo]|uniref:Protein phosphatase n=1 Tax=Acer negundo TaxID=4023 RepID=A0AAD5IP24_ACENE|nr:hypothetical protein LWI28_020758 [Acer negundo]KAK4840658.1 hypothetical protein QYF36_014942 [Acer negundo]
MEMKKKRSSGMSKKIIENCCRTSLDMIMGSFYIPKEDESRPDSQGEDSHFFCQEKKSFGLADGVGGWIKQGIDSGEYSRQLMNNSLIALNHQETRSGHVDPTRVLEEAYYVTNCLGSSTACVIALNDDDHCLHVSNVGDSGFLVFRNSECIFQSPIQQHGFNHPYQLGCTSRFSDSVDIAMEIVVPVQSGDIVVAGTDGLLDNMFPSEIEQIITKAQDQTPAHLALTIADYALYNSLDRFSESPFSRAAYFAGKKHVGGKIDDITVVVAKII